MGLGAAQTCLHPLTHSLSYYMLGMVAFLITWLKCHLFQEAFLEFPQDSKALVSLCSSTMSSYFCLVLAASGLFMVSIFTVPHTDYRVIFLGARSSRRYLNFMFSIDPRQCLGHRKCYINSNLSKKKDRGLWYEVSHRRGLLENKNRQ